MGESFSMESAIASSSIETQYQHGGYPKNPHVNFLPQSQQFPKIGPSPMDPMIHPIPSSLWKIIANFRTVQHVPLTGVGNCPILGILDITL